MTLKPSLPLPLAFGLLCMTTACAADLPRIAPTERGAQLILGGKPFLILGGELGNSSAGTAAQADTILPRLARLHVNTVLMPVAWEQIEPTEGTFDFSILDHWIEVARQQHLHLVPLWFGSWKNAFSNYTPAWVKQDTGRFPRAMAADGSSTEILSTLAPATLAADTHAFAALMTHIREQDAAQQTVLFVQVENEVGFLGRGRDRSPEANRLFAQSVPAALIDNLNQHRDDLSPELAAAYNPQGKTWWEVFTGRADEAFMAFHYATFIEKVAAAGKHAYALPMYLNCQLPSPTERSGEYPGGGPHPYFLSVYRAAAPSIDFYSPDIYWPNFEYWIDRYKHPGSPVFVPEARIETSPLNAFYAYGEAGALGFSAFAIETLELPDDPTDFKEAGSKPADWRPVGTKPSGTKPALAETYAALDNLKDVLIPAQQDNRTRALVLHVDSPRPTQTLALGGYLFEATLSRSWPAKTLLVDDGAILVIQPDPVRDEFYITGRGLTISFYRDPDTDDKAGGIASVEEVTKAETGWITQRRLNGDQTNQGRQLSLAPKEIRIYRVVLYAAPAPAR